MDHGYLDFERLFAVYLAPVFAKPNTGEPLILNAC